MSAARARRPPLLALVQELIERTYAMETGGLHAADFIIGDAGIVELYGTRSVVGRRVRRDSRPMLLARTDVHGEAHVRVYYPDRLIENLERHDPATGLRPENLRDFAAFVEELDHLLLVASAWRRGRPVTGLELELHANVTKELACSLFLARTLGVPRLDTEQRARLHHELHGRGDYESEEDWLAERYRAARRHSVRFLRRLDAERQGERPTLLRRFSHAPLPEKLRLCA